MSVSLAKRVGRHASEIMVEASPVVFVSAQGHVVRKVSGHTDLLVAPGARIRTRGPRHLCSAFDNQTLHTESRCRAQGYDCDCTVLLSRGGWVRGDASFIR